LLAIPKILWLKKHMDPALFSRCQFFDLPDVFTYQATGNAYALFLFNDVQVPDKGLQPDFFERIGLGDLVDGGNWKQMGAARGQVQVAGIPVGRGLSKSQLRNLDLSRVPLLEAV
jgi:ribulose kinase